MIDRSPPAEPYATGFLEVTDRNVLYWESAGNPDGLPAVYLHGGPGGGSWPGSRRYFDPAAYHAVLFDQRGCGRSVPLADSPDVDLDTNTTGHLVSDIEALREHLGVDRWVVLGVSWGVTLGLVYAQAHPGRVIAMVPAAVTSGRRRETDWITRDVGRIFPREWEAFAAGVPEAERGGDLAAAYARLLASPAPAVRGVAMCHYDEVVRSVTGSSAERLTARRSWFRPRPLPGGTRDVGVGGGDRAVNDDATQRGRGARR